MNDSTVGAAVAVAVADACTCVTTVVETMMSFPIFVGA